MLAWKVWRETRTRFALSAAALAWFCGMFVVMRPEIQYLARRPFGQAIVDAIYAGGIRNLYVLFVVALGLGGLTEEVARGSAPFTLALPVSRVRLVIVRALVGTAEVAALSLTPTAVVLALAPMLGERFSVLEAAQYSMQWAATGLALYSVAFLLSVRLAGAYAALTASILVLAIYVSILNLPAARVVPGLNVFALMDAGHPGAPRLAAAVLAAVAVIATSVYATERQDF